MGLDMEIRRISKPHMDDSVVYNREDIHGIILTEDELKEPMYRQLAPYVQQLQVKIQYYDMEKIRKDYKLSDDSYIDFELSGNSSMMSAYRIAITDRGTKKTVEISNEDIESKYTIERVEKRFVCDSEEVRYWRKAYDIQDWFHEHIEEDVENTGFYILSGAMLLAFNKAFPEDRIEAIEPDEEKALFYWEWY